MAPSRRRIIYVNGDRPKAEVCPGCGASLEGIRKSELRRVVIQCRCPRGHVVFEHRCAHCALRIVFRERKSDGELSIALDLRDSPTSLRLCDRASDIEHYEKRYERE